MNNQWYTPEFKEEAVRQVLEKGHTVPALAERLGVSAQPGSVISRPSEEIKEYRETILVQLGHEDITKRLETLKISLGEDPLMSALAEPPEEPFYSWLR